ncbi:MAG: hypothetical protein ABJA78_20055 [Ferruginibacter sp.]
MKNIIKGKRRINCANYMKTIIVICSLCFCCNAAFTQGIESVKVPGFTDPEIKNFCVTRQAQLESYLKAVQQNNKPAIKAAFDKDVSLFSFEKVSKINEKAKVSGAAEYRKYLMYMKELSPFIREIGQHPYVKELSAAWIKNNKTTN